ncbi:Protein of unknown function [Pyronema omphalodes CBS 100304]|uniref:Uncharacterized protein n=1 Tax=Pyronema omphalodes (strain CBS 100304) TaxID=1076935 RepID=U4LL57_PYROM|nr:Protein of unknown function [Pyronema omphalodes CBS 100304]
MDSKIYYYPDRNTTTPPVAQMSRVPPSLINAALFLPQPAQIESPGLQTPSTPALANHITKDQPFNTPPTPDTGSPAAPCAILVEGEALTPAGTAPSAIKRKRVNNKKPPPGDGVISKPETTRKNKQPKTKPTTASAEESYERNRRNGRKLTAVAAHWVNGELVPIDLQVNDTLSTSANVMEGDASVIVSAASSESVSADEPGSNTISDPISDPVAGLVSGFVSGFVSSQVSDVFSGPAYGLISGLVNDLVPSPAHGFAAGPYHDLISHPADGLTDGPVDATISAPITSDAPAHTPLVHPAEPGVDVSGAPGLTGPDDQDADVKPEPGKTKFPSACATLKFCKLPTDGRYKWEQMPKADSLRAVRRFRLRFWWVGWAQAEDYIWEKFQKQEQDITRRRLDKENKEARKRNVTPPHKRRQQWNSKSAATPIGSVQNESGDVTADTSAAAAGVAPHPFNVTEDMPLFLPSGEAGDAADVILVDDDHDYAFRATIENMGQNRSHSAPTTTVGADTVAFASVPLLGDDRDVNLVTAAILPVGSLDLVTPVTQMEPNTMTQDTYQNFDLASGVFEPFTVYEMPRAEMPVPAVEDVHPHILRNLAMLLPAIRAVGDPEFTALAVMAADGETAAGAQKFQNATEAYQQNLKKFREGLDTLME